MSDVIQTSYNTSFSFYAFGLVLGFLLVFLLLTLAIKWLERAELGVSFVYALRNFMLPIMALHLVLINFRNLPSDHVSVKITETILSVAVLYLLVSATNFLFFSERNIFNRDAVLPKLGRDVLNVVLTLVLGAVVLSSVWGLELGHLFAALGVSSLVIGLALQEPLSNLFHGISLLIARPFQRNDWIEFGGESGKVLDFTWRSVKILNIDNQLLIIPNSSIGKLHIKNFSRPTTLHAENITVAFSYNDDPAIVKQALKELALQTKGVLQEPSPQPRTLSYGDFYISYGLKFYIQNFEHKISVTDDLMTSIFEMAKKREFEIPFPVRDLRLHQVSE